MGNTLIFSTLNLSEGTYFYRVYNSQTLQTLIAFQIINLKNMQNVIFLLNAQNGVTYNGQGVSSWEDLVNTNKVVASQSNNNLKPSLETASINNKSLVKFGKNGNSLTYLTLNSNIILNNNQYTIILFYKNFITKCSLKLCVGREHKWCFFWGNYRGGIISVLLIIQKLLEQVV
ncbi:MAG: hypothetical protein R2777_04490 [Chitinophagales bacterium]